eukprot:COSAG01_NODE_3581_length_5911_cov_688.858052_4_plen_150_part_00
MRSVLSDVAAEGVDHLRSCVVEALRAAERGEGPLALEVGRQEARALKMRYTTDIHVKENLPCEVSVRAFVLVCDAAAHAGAAFRSVWLYPRSDPGYEYSCTLAPNQGNSLFYSLGGLAQPAHPGRPCKQNSAGRPHSARPTRSPTHAPY